MSLIEWLVDSQPWSMITWVTATGPSSLPFIVCAKVSVVLLSPSSLVMNNCEYYHCTSLHLTPLVVSPQTQVILMQEGAALIKYLHCCRCKSIVQIFYVFQLKHENVCIKAAWTVKNKEWHAVWSFIPSLLCFLTQGGRLKKFVFNNEWLNGQARSSTPEERSVTLTFLDKSWWGDTWVIRLVTFGVKVWGGGRMQESRGMAEWSRGEWADRWVKRRLFRGNICPAISKTEQPKHQEITQNTMNQKEKKKVQVIWPQKIAEMILQSRNK